MASDAGPSSLGAVRVAILLARRRSASVHALIVAAPFPHTIRSMLAMSPPAIVDDDHRRMSLEQLRSQLATVRGTREWTMRATTGFPAESINDAAARWPASMVILGTGRHTLADRLLGSETAVSVAAHATVPVLAVPAETEALPRRAVAAVDFSDASVAAAAFAATLLGPKGVLTLLFASPLVVEGSSPTGTLTDLYTAGARDRLARIANDIGRRSKRTVLFDLATGGIVDRLMGFVDDNQCDLVALGAHEPGITERLLIGRVRTDVIRHAPCSVLVVPQARAE